MEAPPAAPSSATCPSSCRSRVERASWAERKEGRNRLKTEVLSRSLEEHSMFLLTNDTTSKNNYSRYFTRRSKGLTRSLDDRTPYYID